MSHLIAPVNPDVADTATPPIPETVGWISAYSGSFGPPVNLVQAVPGHAPHALLLDALKAVSSDPFAARYGDIYGDSALREAYAAQSQQHYGTPVAAGNIAITAGCNMAFMVAIMAVAKAGDAVLVPCPWYFNHQMTLSMLGIECRPLPVLAQNDYMPDPDMAASLMDDRVKAIVLVSPNNPTGATYPAELIRSFMDLCRKKGRWLVLDETYRDFLPEGPRRGHDLYADPDWGRNLIGLYSFSKAYALPGWRLGALHAGEAIMPQIGKLLDCIQICPARAGQIALASTMHQLGEWREQNRQAVNRRTAIFRHSIANFDGWVVEQTGAYFAYLKHPFRGRSASEVCRALMVERGVMTLPASAFGGGQEDRLRVAIANVTQDIIATLPARLEGFAL
jgi:aspartate/methionine/tyrosine aminotransferase